jgi:hypothetical protein
VQLVHPSHRKIETEEVEQQEQPEHPIHLVETVGPDPMEQHPIHRVEIGADPEQVDPECLDLGPQLTVVPSYYQRWTKDAEAQYPNWEQLEQVEQEH